LLSAILLLNLVAVTPPEARQAEELVHACMRDYDLGEFDQALREAVEAYRIDPLPAILFNIGQCHRALGHWDKAVFFFQRYLSKLPAAPNRKNVEELLAASRRQLKEQQRRPAPAQPASQSVVVVSPRPLLPAATRPAPPPPKTESAPPAAVSTAGEVEARPARSNAPWWLVGTGALVAVVGGGLAGYELAARQSSSQPGGYTSYSVTPSAAQTANTVSYIGQVALGAGVAALIGGVAWALVRPAAKPEVAP
jgi:tetratricopeptide (TPR) repeat protein